MSTIASPHIPLRWPSRRLAMALAVALVSVAPTSARAQSRAGVIVGTVSVAGATSAVPFAGVLLPDLRREALADQQGRFAFRDLEATPTLVRVRRVGFAPLDTLVSIGSGETTFVRLSLVPLPARLQALRIVGSSRVRLAAGCPAFRNENERMLIMSLLDQFVQNAEQYQSLVRAHPFWVRFSYAKLTRHVDGTVASELPNDPRVGPVDHLLLVASDRPAYQAGKVFRRVRGADEVFVPELQDFADEAFMMNHCFSFAGDTTVDSTAFVRLRFAPIAAMADPDIQGTAYLRANDYTLARVEMRTTAVTERFAKSYASVTVQLGFRELLPGIVVLSHLESYLVPGPEERKRFPTVASRGELQDFVSVRWMKGPP